MKRISASFSIEREERTFQVRFTPVKSGWWNVVLTEGLHTLSHKQEKVPPNFTNAIRFLDGFFDNATTRTPKPKRPNVRIHKT